MTMPVTTLMPTMTQTVIATTTRIHFRFLLPASYSLPLTSSWEGPPGDTINKRSQKKQSVVPVSRRRAGQYITCVRHCKRDLHVRWARVSFAKASESTNVVLNAESKMQLGEKIPWMRCKSRTPRTKPVALVLAIWFWREGLRTVLVFRPLSEPRPPAAWQLFWWNLGEMCQTEIVLSEAELNKGDCGVSLQHPTKRGKKAIFAQKKRTLRQTISNLQSRVTQKGQKFIQCTSYPPVYVMIWKKRFGFLFHTTGALSCVHVRHAALFTLNMGHKA